MEAADIARFLLMPLVGITAYMAGKASGRLKMFRAFVRASENWDRRNDGAAPEVMIPMLEYRIYLAKHMSGDFDVPLTLKNLKRGIKRATKD